MQFLSDNCQPVAPEIMAALQAANENPVASYGGDQISKSLKEIFSEVFERDVDVLPVVSGTAANALAVSVMIPPYGTVVCHEQSHLRAEECGAPEFYSGGGRMSGCAGTHGKLDAKMVSKALHEDHGDSPVHFYRPSGVSLTQATECGTVYRPDEVKEISQVAANQGLPLHMDGTRLANALAFLGCTPAELTWKAGVDILSFGATKNGALNAEALVFFRPEWKNDLAFRHKRGGHLISKMRFLSVQLKAYLKDDLWLKYARHANDQAKYLEQGLSRIGGELLLHPVEANLVFVAFPRAWVDALREAGWEFFSWTEGDRFISRLVTSFNTRPERVDDFLKAVESCAK